MAKGLKTGGRMKGTPNKTTEEIRSMLSRIIGKEIENIPKHLSMIDPEKRLHILIKLLPYIVPVYTNGLENNPKEDAYNFFQSLNNQIIEKKGYKN